MKQRCRHSHLARENTSWGGERHGWTLVQMLVVMSMIMVMTTIAVRLISSLLRVERQAIGEVTRTTSLSRLSRQFRTDAHFARECEALAPLESDRVRLKLANSHVVTYRTQSRGVVRVERDADRLVRQDLYRIPGSIIACEKSAGETPLVTLVVERPVAGERPPPLPVADQTSLKRFRIEARLGRDIND